MGDVTVVIGTFGSRHWAELAWSRAEPSVPEGIPVYHVHHETLAKARNEALGLVETEWVIHLDADDELEPGYVDALLGGSADLRAPAVRYVHGGRERPPYVPRVAGHDHDCTAECLRGGNWLVVGTLARAQQLRDVGGWREWDAYEDWDLWLRCWLAGATVEAIQEAVYRAYVRTKSRNRGLSMSFKNDVHAEILAANVPEFAEAA